MKVIFGSGLIGLLARHILGPDWTVIPFYKSRYFTFNPPLADNFIIRHNSLDDFIGNLMGEQRLVLYKRAWSVAGELVKSVDRGLLSDWLSKIFRNNIPSHTELVFKDLNFFVYNARCRDIYVKLYQLYIDELVKENQKGPVTEIGDHYFKRGNETISFDKAINTVSLDYMCKLANKNVQLNAVTVSYYHLRSKVIDFEGNNQVLVVDRDFGFYKVTNVAPERYLFYCNNNIDDPGIYFRQFAHDVEIIDGTTLDRVLPSGLKQDNLLSEYGIFNVGSNAQWDWCMDVGSCIIRLLSY